MDHLIIAGLALSLFGTVAGFIYTWFRDGRARRWALEDAQRVSNHLEGKINEGKSAAAIAYNEANSVNEKIEVLSKSLVSLNSSHTKLVAHLLEQEAARK